MTELAVNPRTQRNGRKCTLIVRVDFEDGHSEFYGQYRDQVKADTVRYKMLRLAKKRKIVSAEVVPLVYARTI